MQRVFTQDWLNYNCWLRTTDFFCEICHGNFIFTLSFCQNSAETKSLKKYFSYFFLHDSYLFNAQCICWDINNIIRIVKYDSGQMSAQREWDKNVNIFMGSMCMTWRKIFGNYRFRQSLNKYCLQNIVLLMLFITLITVIFHLKI